MAISLKMSDGPRYRVAVIFFAAAGISSVCALLYVERLARGIARVKINEAYETQTVVKPSTIPRAGNGLFAAVRIEKDGVIGELGGRLVADDDPSQGNHYIASVLECAWEKTDPYKSLDSRDYGGKVSRINFAPDEINGIKTNFQNAAIRQICEHPYFIFVALRDIEPGEEIWSSYGSEYDYDQFMLAPEVRDFFCRLLQIDCREEFTYSP